MNQPHYSFEYAKKEKLYQFTSSGKHGEIKKVVQFRLIHEDVYNLGFGDFDEQTKIIDDTVVTDNGDMELIFSTIIAIIDRFFKQNPGAKIFLTGSTPARTRLYQIIITLNLADLTTDFDIYGFNQGSWHEFQKNEKYESFLVMKLL